MGSAGMPELPESCKNKSHVQTELEMYENCARYNEALVKNSKKREIEIRKKRSKSSKKRELEHKQLIKKKCMMTRDMGGFLEKLHGNTGKSDVNYSFQKFCPVCRRWEQEFREWDFEMIHDVHQREQEWIKNRQLQQRRRQRKKYGLDEENINTVMEAKYNLHFDLADLRKCLACQG